MAFRPDYAQWLIFYPYYIKDQAASDEESIKFYYINGNLRLMAEEGKNINLIQKLMSINDEQKNDYIKLALGIHRHLKKWHESLKIKVANGRCKFKNGPVFNIRPGI